MYTVKFKLDNAGYMPQRTIPTSNVFNLKATQTGTIYKNDSLTFDTKVHIIVPEGLSALIYPDFYLCKTYNLMSFAEANIDSNFRDTIQIKIFNFNDSDYTIHRGDIIGQLVLYKNIIDLDTVEIKEL